MGHGAAGLTRSDGRPLPFAGVSGGDLATGVRVGSRNPGPGGLLARVTEVSTALTVSEDKEIGMPEEHTSQSFVLSDPPEHPQLRLTIQVDLPSLRAEVTGRFLEADLTASGNLRDGITCEAGAVTGGTVGGGEVSVTLLNGREVWVNAQGLGSQGSPYRKQAYLGDIENV